ncbi:ubiquitin-like-conjugating enzyme ATG10 [Neocloeon triangulifer]|uniref:ubiquitin-like-conjugating enzyme ATG10 n=1 Tax=Neocloeon triangulifer TaxID=2078957 RepID=UPI00286FA4E9|nr:ubiquitin-like-conjugating enzyme ATG10 [Neocloeon triangulifer]
MQITWEMFMMDISVLKEKSDSLNDGWEIKGDPSQVGLAYLFKTLKKPLKPSMPLSCCQELEDASLELKQLDFASKSASNSSEMVVFEYHILYSLSYGVPVLYFNAWKSDGSLLEIEKVWDLASSPYKDAVKESKWGAVSQQDHPIIGKPYFFFHPCNTARLLEDVCSGDPKSNRVLAWLSLVAPLVGLSIPYKFAK